MEAKNKSLIQKLKEKREKEEVKEKEKLDAPPIPPPEIKKEEEPKAKPKIGLTEKMKQIQETLDILTQKKTGKQKKKPLLNWNIKRQLKAMALKNKVLVIYLRTNRAIDTLTAEIKDGMIGVKDKIYDANTAFTYLWKGKFPCIVVKEWDLEPVGTKDYFDAMDAGNKVDAQTVIIRHLESKEAINAKKLSGKTLIWILIGVAVVFYVLFAGGS